MACANAPELLGLPSIREEIESRLVAALPLIERDDAVAAGVDSILAGLRLELARIAGIAEEAVGVASGAIGVRGAELDAALAELSRIDASVLDSEARDVVGFLFSSASEAVGGRAKTLDDSLQRTVGLYRAVAESSRWHADRLQSF